MSEYRKGMLVENTACPQWGPGKIVHVDDRLHIIFRDLEEEMAKKYPLGSSSLRFLATKALQDTDHSFPRGRPHREVSFRRRRSLSLIISLISAAGRISIVPHLNLTPGLWEMSFT
jgi:hypothetical protein